MKTEIPFYIVATFILLVLALIIVIIAGTNAALNRSGSDGQSRRKKIFFLSSGILAWLVFMANLAANNAFSNFSAMPPRLLLVLLPPLIVTIFLAGSKAVSKLLKSVPSHWLIIIQSFRMIMEIILWSLFIENIIPRQMTFEGRNFDFLTGLTGLIVGVLVYKKIISSPRFIIGWNVIGLALLINIVSVAILSAPFPFRMFMNDPANTVIAYFPFIWLPGFVVPVAYCMHVLSIKQALVKMKDRN